MTWMADGFRGAVATDALVRTVLRSWPRGPYTASVAAGHWERHGLGLYRTLGRQRHGEARQGVWDRTRRDSKARCSSVQEGTARHY